MAPRLPDRYETQVRLGRVGDIEEWLATDRSLDRPVLVRILESSAAPERRAEFLDTIRAAAAAHHVGPERGLRGRDPGEPVRRGRVDRRRLTRRPAQGRRHPGGPGISGERAAAGRRPRGDARGGLRARGHRPWLGRVRRGPARQAGGLRDETAVRIGPRRHQCPGGRDANGHTGRDHPGIRPSQVAEGLPPEADGILADAEGGRLSAETLAAQLRSLPEPQEGRARSAWSWRWSVVTAVLIVLALGISAVGANIDIDPDSRSCSPRCRTTRATSSGRPCLRFRSEVPPSIRRCEASSPEVRSSPTKRACRRSWIPRAPPRGTRAITSCSCIPRATECCSSSWSTERRPARAGRVPGNRVSAAVASRPGRRQRGSRMVRNAAGRDEHRRLPVRTDGVWLLRLTRLPELSDGRFGAELATVHFLP